MPPSTECNYLVQFTDFGYGRSALCPKCGSRIVPETAYQKTSRCKASICKKCGQSTSPMSCCKCDKLSLQTE